jgi:geranylgeranyl pyrophosphate synthase
MITAADQTNDPSLVVLYADVQSWFEPAALRAALGFGDTLVERISLDWLARAGKRWRPFLAVCLHRVFGGGTAAVDDGIRAVALALECIHKGSLIYDDIQDDDDVRYGEPTLHRVHGLPLAMTASLLLIGQGYRMLADAADRDPARRAEMLSLATDGHCRLCLGQGGELAWMRAPRPLTPAEVLDIFRLKTAPSFDVVFRLPAICAGASPAVHEALARFAAVVGTAYQIQDDLDDYHGHGDVDDILSHRPSIVMAFAYARATADDRAAIAAAWCGDGKGVDRERVRRIIATVGAAVAARDSIEDHRRQALVSIAGLPGPLRELLTRVADMILPAP